MDLRTGVPPLHSQMHGVLWWNPRWDLKEVGKNFIMYLNLFKLKHIQTHTKKHIYIYYIQINIDIPCSQKLKVWNKRTEGFSKRCCPSSLFCWNLPDLSPPPCHAASSHRRSFGVRPWRGSPRTAAPRRATADTAGKELEHPEDGSENPRRQGASSGGKMWYWDF